MGRSSIEILPQVIFFVPGQDSQYQGMGDKLKEFSPAARNVYRLADVEMKRRTGSRGLVSRVSAEGTPEEQLRYAQIITATGSLATIAAIREELGQNIFPDYVAGSSLGETAAANIAGAVSRRTAINMTIDRELVMTEEAEKNPGRMAVISGISRDLIANIAQATGVVVSNTFPVSTHAIISGHIKGIEKAISEAIGQGAKLAKQLKIPLASHSPLMLGAAEQYHKLLEKYNFSAPKTHFIMDAVNDVVVSANDVRNNLAAALIKPVAIDKLLQLFISSGGKHFVDIGPGDAMSKSVERAKLSLQTIKMDRDFLSSMQEVARIAGK